MGGFPETSITIRNDRNRFLPFVWKDVSLCVSISLKCVHLEIFEVDGLTFFFNMWLYSPLTFKMHGSSVIKG